MIDFIALKQWLNDKKQGQHHRQILTIVLPIEESKQVLDHLLTAFPTQLLISDNKRYDGLTNEKPTLLIKPKSYKQLLGNEFDLIIYDISQGIDFNALYAVSGMLLKQGLLVLAEQNDTSCPSGIALSYGSSRLNSLFYQHFKVAVKAADMAFINARACAFPSSQINEDKISNEKLASCSSLPLRLNEAQHKILDDVSQTLCQTTNKKHLSILLGERGRGKSTLLAHIATHYLYWRQNQTKRKFEQATDRDYTVEVCCAYRSQAKTLIQHFETQMKMDEDSKEFTIVYRAPDEVINAPNINRLLLIDEVASLAPEIIKQIVNVHQKVILCGTTVGYEGSANGFIQRVLPFLASQIKLHTYQLNNPIRWFSNDPIEKLFNKLLGQDAEIAVRNNEGISSNITPNRNLVVPQSEVAKSKIHMREVTQNELLSEPRLYQALFSLLVAAHYQTTPNDIVRILDEENCKVMIMEIANDKNTNQETSQFESNQAIMVGALCLFEEGGNLLSELADDISCQQRRVQGHMSAQALSSYIVEPTLCTYKYWRVNRIAISPDFRRQELGSTLLAFCESKAKINNIDIVSTSFGYTKDLFQFWEHNQYHLVKIGQRIDTSSATASVMMIKQVSESITPFLSILHAKVAADYLYFTTFDEVLIKIYESLSELIQSSNPPSSAVKALHHKVVTTFFDNRISFSIASSVLFQISQNFEDPVNRKHLKDLFYSLYKGHLHRHERIHIENEIIHLLSAKK